MNNAPDTANKIPLDTKKNNYRVALFVGTVAALLFFLLFAKGRAPASVVDLLTSDSITELSLHGGSRIELSVAHGNADQETTNDVAEAMRSHGADVTRAADSKITIELVEFDVAAARAWARQLASGGRFSMQMVLEDSEFMKAAYAVARESGEAMGISTDIDQWSHDDSGARFVDYYLLGETREALEKAVKHWLDTGVLALPPGAVIGYEKLQSRLDDESPIQWRTYLLDSTKELSNQDIYDASLYWNPTNNKPEVLVEFSEEGGRKFAELTGAHIGEKVAILLGEDINSAPTIQAQIGGGSTSISMGDSDPQTMQAEAQALVSMLRGPSLAAELDVISVVAVQQLSESKLLLARLLMALVAGLSIALLTHLLAMLLGQVARPTPVTLVQPASQRQWFAIVRPLLVSLGGMACVLVLGTRWLPGAEVVLGGTSMSVITLSWVAIGLGPFLSGAVLAEGLAFLIPPWRRRRGGDTATRAPIENLALVLGLALLAAQAFFLSQWIGSFILDGSFSVRSFSQPEFSERAVLIALLGGSAALYIIAKLISRYGLGNGYAVVLLAGTLALVPDFLKQATALSTMDAFAFFKAFMLAAIAMVVSTSLIRRTVQTGTGRLTLPLTGIAPLLIGPAILGVILAASRVGQLEETLIQAEEFLYSMQFVSVVVASVLITAFALRRPSSQARIVSGATSASDSRSLVIAIVISIAFPLGLYYLMTSIEALGEMVIPLTMLVLGPALALDLAGEFRARFRNPELVPVWDLQRPRYVLPITQALAHADIDCFVRGRYLRTLLSVVGPFIPMAIMVPKEKVSEARELIRGQI